MSTCTHLYCVFIYGINIPGCPNFTRTTIRGRLSCSGQDDFTLAWIGPRPDTLVIKSQTRNSATYVAEWVARQIGRPAVGRDSDCIGALYPKALELAKTQFKERFDPEKCAVKLGNNLWKLGAVFANHGVSGPVVMKDTTVVKVLARFQDDTVIVLKREEMDSGVRITWGERVNKVVWTPWHSALSRSVLCTSRSATTLRKATEASADLSRNH
jgi:hypothetical protein